MTVRTQHWTTLAIFFFAAVLSYFEVRGEDPPGQKQFSGTLDILITRLRSDKGVVRIGLFDSQETFCKKGKEVRTAVVKPDSRQAAASFKDLPYGSYAVSLYHDENDNDEHDLGLILDFTRALRIFQQCESRTEGTPAFRGGDVHAELEGAGRNDQSAVAKNRSRFTR